MLYSASGTLVTVTVLEITNRYNENDGVSRRVHKLAFGIVICFGSEG